MNQDNASLLELLESVTMEWMRMANLCSRVVELTEQGFTIDSETLKELRDAVNDPKFAHALDRSITE